MDFLKKVKKLRMNIVESPDNYQQAKHIISNPYALEILELIRSLDGDILHGRFIVDKEVDLTNVKVQAFDCFNNLISSNYLFYENREYFENIYDLENKRAIEFSIHIKWEHHNISLYLFNNNEIINDSLFVFNENDFKKLIDSADQRYPTQSKLDKAMTLIYNEQKSTENTLHKQINAKFKYEPLFSIIVPLYNTKIVYFKEMIDSVIAQSYSRWELILVNASPDNTELKKEILDYFNKYENVTIVELNENKGITLNTKEGIDIAKGEYICFLDHDDTIEPDALFHYTQAINSIKTEANLLYCDEDKLDNDGTHTEFFLKGNFSIDALMHRNYICHFMAVKSAIFNRCNYCNSAFDGAQDHYLALQCSISPETILHIPRVLYHWRKADGSTAASSTNKSYANEAGLLIVDSYIKNNDINGIAIPGNKPYSYFVKYNMENDSSLTVIIDATSNIGNTSITLKTIDLLLDINNLEVIVICHPQNMRKFKPLNKTAKKAKIIELQTKDNKCYIINKYVQTLKTKFILFLDSNIQIINKETIQELLGRIQRKDVGAVGPMIVYPDDTIASTGICVNLPKPTHISRGHSKSSPGYLSLNNCEQNLSAISEICMMTSKENFINAGGFNLEYEHHYFDIDYCLKLRDRGKLIIYTPTILVTYNGEFLINTYKNRKYQLEELKDRSKLIKNWSDFFLKGDPYINGNFGNSSLGSFYYLPKTNTIY